MLEEFYVMWQRLLIACIMEFCWLNYIAMELKEDLMIGSGPV
jgi:hypothetical protein